MSKVGIHVLDNKNEEIIGYFTNNSKKMMVLDNVHSRNAEDHSETFDFRVPYKYTKTFENQNRVLIPDEFKGKYREFTIKNVETSDNEIFVQSNGAWLDDLQNNSEPLPPFNHQNITVDEAVNIALARTGYEKGHVDFDGFIDLVTTEYKTAYEVLLMIEDLTGLQFNAYITVEGNSIISRKIEMKEGKSFSGKELVRGHNITGIKKRESSDELVTALILTSTDSKGKALVTKVYNEEARDRWGNNGKYSWSIYNIEAKESDNMTVEKMQAKGQKVLKQMINTKVDYEVTAVEIHRQLSKQARYGDRIRVRDVVYQPHFYMEATVKTVTRDIFDDSSKQFTLGEIKTFKESDLKKYFNSLKSELQEKLNDNILNIDSIIGDINEVVADNSIHKANTAPTNETGIIPTNKLWLDTSTKPAILKRWNGTQWIIDSPTKPSDVGAIDTAEATYIANTKVETAKTELSTAITNSYDNAVSAAQTKVDTAKTEINKAITDQKTALTTDINNSYTKAVADAETKAKALDASITQTVNANKQAADKTMSDLNTALNSTSNKVGTIEQNVTAAQNNITTLTNTTNAQQTAIQNAQSDISGLKTTIGQHTSSISNLDNQIKLTATKTEVQSAVDGIEFGGVNKIRNSILPVTSHGGGTLSKVRINTPFGEQEIGRFSTTTPTQSLIRVQNVLSQEDSGKDFTFSIWAKTSVAGATANIDMDIADIQLKAHTVTDKWQRFFITSRFTYRSDIYRFVDIGIRTANVEVDIGLWQLEEGTKATPYDISPLDRDALISQNSAAIVVANNEIIKRVTKTEYDTRTGQIEQIANTAKSTADTNSQTITTVKGNVDSLTQWRADKGTAMDQTINAVSTKAWLTDISPIDGRLQTAEANITTNANEILKRVTKTTYDADTQRIEGTANTAKSTAESNTTAITTVSGKVGALEQWRTDKGSQIDQTINSVSTKVWTNDIDKLEYSNLNLLIDSAKDRVSTRFLMIDIWDILAHYVGKTITISFDIQAQYSRAIRVYPYQSHGISFADTINVTPLTDQFKRFSLTTTVKNWGITNNTYTKGSLAFYDGAGDNNYIVKNIKIELGSKATPYTPNPKDAENKMAEIKVTADGALTKATNIGNDYVKQSAVLVQPDGVLIGSKKVSGTEMASAISVTPSNVDIITRVMRVTGDMQVAGDIKSLSLSAVNADIANLRASILTADSVTATALKADTALIQKLNTNALLTNYLIADTAMINSIKTNALTAVRADIAWLKANVITADSITSTALKVDTALIDKLNVNSILTNKLIADTAMINAIKSNSITATRGDIAWLKSNIITADSIDATALKSDAAMIDKLFATSALITQLTSKQAFISNIKAIDIDLNRATVRGAIGTNYLQLTADELTQYGTYTRTWRGVTSTENVFTRLKNGYIRFRNNDKNRSLYMSEFGVSTYVDGEGEGGGSSGTIQWWDPKYSPSNAFGITVNSYGGVAALTSDTNRTMIDSYLSVNLESTTAPINFKPEKNNSGNNSFQLSIVDAVHPTDTDGFLMYGSEVNGWGAGLRFSKSAAEQTVYVVNGNKERGGNATLDAGTVKANDVQTRSGSYSVYWNGSSGGTTGGESGLQNLYATGIKTRGTDSDMFLATQNGGWVRVTDGYGYNNGKGITYRGIAVSEYKTMSHHSLKHEITEWDYDVLEVIKNEWITYQYKLKNDPSGEFKRGTVVGGGYSTIPELVDSEGVKMYEMATWSMEAIKQLIFKVEALEEKINQK